MNATQIAAEAAEKWFEEYEPQFEPGTKTETPGLVTLTAIIQAAIEKAWQDGYVDGSNYQIGISRAAHASEDLWRQWENRLHEWERKQPFDDRTKLACDVLSECITELRMTKPAHASDHGAEAKWLEIWKQANIVCALSGAVAHDCDHYGITRPKWWKAVQKLQKLINATDAHNATLSGEDWFDERKEANEIASKGGYDAIYDAAITAFKRQAATLRGEDTRRLDWLNSIWGNVNIKRLQKWDDVREAIDAAMKEQG